MSLLPPMPKKSKYYSSYRRRKKRKNWTFEIIVAIGALLLIVCAYAGKINPQSFVGAPFLMLAFIPMLILMLAVFVAALFWRRWLAVLAVLISVVATLPILKFYVGMNSADNIPPTPADQSLILKVMTYNVLGFNYNEPKLSAQPSETMKLILDADPDVVLLQEGVASGLEWEEIPSLVPYMKQVRAKYPYLYSSPEGLNIISKYPFTTQTIGEPQHQRSPLGYNRETNSYLARAYDLQLPSGKQLRLMDFRLQSYHLSFGKSKTVRVSPSVKLSPLERMRRSFALRGDDASTLRQAIDASPANLIVCGDMNDVSTSYVYRTICGDDLKDTWFEVGRGYGHSFNRHHLPYRIDHIFYRGDVRALSVKRIKGGSSDHYPLMATFDIEITDKK